MKKIINISVWVVLILGLFVMLGFVDSAEDNLKIKKLEIRVDESSNNFFVDKQDIQNLIFNTGDSILGQPMNTVNVQHLEKLINNHPAISNAEVYKSLNGKVSVEVKQRNPLLRIFNYNNESFYIDEDGKFMPLSAKYTARVLVANGNIFGGYNLLHNLNMNEILANKEFAEKTMVDDLFLLAQFITKDKFWKAQIEQIFVNENREIELIPRVGEHKIIFGDTNDMQEKFKKLMIFYRKGLANTGWNEYHIINLKFKNQVVCTKKNSSLVH